MQKETESPAPPAEAVVEKLVSPTEAEAPRSAMELMDMYLRDAEKEEGVSREVAMAAETRIGATGANDEQKGKVKDAGVALTAGTTEASARLREILAGFGEKVVGAVANELDRAVVGIRMSYLQGRVKESTTAFKKHEKELGILEGKQAGLGADFAEVEQALQDMRQQVGNPNLSWWQSRKLHADIRLGEKEERKLMAERAKLAEKIEVQRTERDKHNAKRTEAANQMHEMIGPQLAKHEARRAQIDAHTVQLDARIAEGEQSVKTAQAQLDMFKSRLSGMRTGVGRKNLQYQIDAANALLRERTNARDSVKRERDQTLASMEGWLGRGPGAEIKRLEKVQENLGKALRGEEGETKAEPRVEEKVEAPKAEPEAVEAVKEDESEVIPEAEVEVAEVKEPFLVSPSRFADEWNALYRHEAVLEDIKWRRYLNGKGFAYNTKMSLENLQFQLTGFFASQRLSRPIARRNEKIKKVMGSLQSHG